MLAYSTIKFYKNPLLFENIDKTVAFRAERSFREMLRGAILAETAKKSGFCCSGPRGEPAQGCAAGLPERVRQ
jgi:hypothetical protein